MMILTSCPVRMAAVMVALMPLDATHADLRAACTTVLTEGYKLGEDALKYTAKARRLADAIDRGLLV